MASERTETRRQRRRHPRWRTRLRTGKVATLSNGFIADCLIFDRSECGARLRLVEPVELPEHIKLFDDELTRLLVAVVIWRRDNELGVEFPDGQGNGETCGKGHAALSGKYYAV